MSDLNSTNLTGRLTRDADLKFTSGGTGVCKFSIASNYKKKNGDQWVDEVNYFDIVLWGKRGEALNQYLTKGKQIGVTGEMRQERWNDRDSGQARSKIEVIASNVQLLGGTGSGEGSGRTGSQGQGSGGGYSSGRQSAPQQRQNNPPDDDGFSEDIPF